MKLLRVLIFIIILSGIIAIPVISIGNANNLNKTLIEKANREDNKQQKNITYEFKNLEKYESSFVYKIKYPVFNIKDINEKVYEEIEYLASSFKNDFIDSYNSDDKYIFILDTDVSIFKDKLLFVKFTGERNYKTYPNPIKFYQINIIDIEKNELLNIDDVLNDGYEDLFYILAKEYFFKNYGVTITNKSQNYDDIKPVKGVYKDIFLKDDFAQIYIYDYKKQENVLLNIPFESVLPYIKKEYIDISTSTEPKTEISTSTEPKTEISTSTEPKTEKATSTETTTILKRKIDKNKPYIYIDRAKNRDIYINRAKNRKGYIDRAKNRDSYIDRAKNRDSYINRAKNRKDYVNRDNYYFKKKN